MNKVAIIFLFFVFYFKASAFIDPDFGWHFRMGELILKQGIPNTDPFSYTMPSFPFVDHEWLTDLIYYHLYQTIGITGMALLLTIIGSAVILIIRSQTKSRFFLAPFLLAGATFLPFWGVRPQGETWFLTAILLTIISKDNLWTKWKWLSPLYFLLWANLHGGFAGGLIIFYLYLGFKAFAQRKIAKSDFILAILCLGATLINPYGFGLWKEIWQQISDNNLRWSIIEWTPIIIDFNWVFLISFIPLLTLSGILIFHFRSRFTLPKLGIYTALLLASLSSQRHIPLWVLIALPLTSQGLEWLYREISPKKLAQKRLNQAYQILVIVSFSFLVLQTISFVSDLKNLKEENYYPQQAIQQLLKYPLNGRIFSDYGWGGYLIWQLPQHKVFVDGRMPSWRWQPPSKQESPAAFDEYNKILYDPGGLKILDKYQIRYVLWPIENKTEKFRKKLENAGWQKVYQDPVSIIYQRPFTLSP